MEDSKKWKQVKVCVDSMEAQLIRGLLESENVPVRLENFNMQELFPGTGFNKIKLYVPQEYVEKAEKLINTFYEGNDE